MIIVISDGEAVKPDEAAFDRVLQVSARAQAEVVYRFNPSGVDRVARVKLLAAAMIQELMDEQKDRLGAGPSSWFGFLAAAQTSIITACMWAVKVVTDGK